MSSQFKKEVRRALEALSVPPTAAQVEQRDELPHAGQVIGAQSEFKLGEWVELRVEGHQVGGPGLGPIVDGGDGEFQACELVFNPIEPGVNGVAVFGFGERGEQASNLLPAEVVETGPHPGPHPA